VPGVGDIPISGKLDRLDKKADGTVTVIDYKTGKAKSENEIRGLTQSSDGGYYRQLVFYKLLLNSLYGKFAESEEKQAIIVHPNEAQLAKLSEENEIMPGVFLAPEISEVPHVHVPISAHITAIARRTLYGYLDNGRDIYYCDTDSVVTTATFPESNELGGLKLEATGSGEFYQPKVYRFGNKVKAKGFSLGKTEPVERFNELVRGGEVSVNLQMSIKQMFRKGIIEPTQVEVVKRLQKSRPKRKFDKTGDSRPWTIEELEVDK
jgi:hypothetical protein